MVSEAEVKTPTWGGSRPGAGRKAEMEDSGGLTIHLPRKVLEALRSEAREFNLPISKYMRGVMIKARPDLPW